MTKKTRSEGKTLEEANNINKSLMVLGNPLKEQCHEFLHRIFPHSNMFAEPKLLLCEIIERCESRISMRSIISSSFFSQELKIL